MRIFNIVFALLFVIFAALQYNDPDPWLWMPVYLYGALLCWLGFKGKYYPFLLWPGLGVYTVYAVYLFLGRDGVWAWLTEHRPEDIAATMQADKPWIEASREFLGLMILDIALLANVVWFARMNRVLTTGK